MKRLMLVLTLVLLPSQVLAECAWVLWARLLMDGIVVSWEPESSFESLVGCKEEVARRLLGEVASKPGAKLFGDTVVWTAEELTANITIRCLPDTVDPREKERG